MPAERRSRPISKCRRMKNEKNKIGFEAAQSTGRAKDRDPQLNGKRDLLQRTQAAVGKRVWYPLFFLFAFGFLFSGKGETSGRTTAPFSRCRSIGLRRSAEAPLDVHRLGGRTVLSAGLRAFHSAEERPGPG